LIKPARHGSHQLKDSGHNTARQLHKMIQKCKHIQGSDTTLRQVTDITQAATNMKVQDGTAPCRHIDQAVYIVRLNI